VEEPIKPANESDAVLPSVDLEGLKEEWQTSGIIDSMDDIVETFIEESNMQLSMLVEAFGRKDLTAVAALAHKIKSSVASLHVRRLEKLLHAIEADASGGSDSNGNLHQLVLEAMREWDEVRRVFDEARNVH
jgi:HPt (histidine-containing phosphotransfer) domain-containing protein